MFEHAIATAMPMISSDHSPIIFQPMPKLRSGKSFKFEAYWEEHEECDATIREGWGNSQSKDDLWETLFDKTRSYQNELLKWNKKTFKRVDEEIFNLKKRLNDLLDVNSSQPNWEEIKHVKLKIAQLWKQEETFWKQRSRIKWLEGGDRSTKFFHASTIQRRSRNRLHRIKDMTGNWIEGQGEICKAILDHFTEVYNSEGVSNIYECLMHVPRLITQEMNDSLLAPVTDVEIKRAMDGLGGMKALGPDGYNGMFFQKHWEVVKTEVCAAIEEFFLNGQLPNVINETIVALVPKIPLPESIHQIRPISSCNFLPKIISKILVLRMKSMMGHIITQNQSAFIGGKLIQDNLLVAHEIFHALKKKGKRGKEGIAIKLDMSKAYDRLEWEFIRKALIVYGFSMIWVERVMQLVTTVSYRYQVNGFLTSKLIPKRGIRQVDPLSPYIFILAANVLSHMILGNRNRGTIQGLALSRDGLKLTHLFFCRWFYSFWEGDYRGGVPISPSS